MAKFFLRLHACYTKDFDGKKLAPFFFFLKISVPSIYQFTIKLLLYLTSKLSSLNILMKAHFEIFCVSCLGRLFCRKKNFNDEVLSLSQIDNQKKKKTVTTFQIAWCQYKRRWRRRRRRKNAETILLLLQIFFKQHNRASFWLKKIYLHNIVITIQDKKDKSCFNSTEVLRKTEKKSLGLEKVKFNLGDNLKNYCISEFLKSWWEKRKF